jgi:hypothetical protein
LLAAANSEWFTELLLTLETSVEAGQTDTRTAALRELLGHEPRTVEEFLIENAARFNLRAHGFGLDQGESLGQLLSQGPVTPALAHLFTDKHGFGWLSEDDFVNHFAADVDPVRAKVMYAVQQPLAMLTFGDVMGVPTWKTLPSWYLVTADDEAIPPAAERQFAARMGATTIEISSSHVPMVSHPSDVAQLIKSAAEAVLATSWTCLPPLGMTSPSIRRMCARAAGPNRPGRPRRVSWLRRAGGWGAGVRDRTHRRVGGQVTGDPERGWRPGGLQHQGGGADHVRGGHRRTADRVRRLVMVRRPRTVAYRSLACGGQFADGRR